MLFIIRPARIPMRHIKFFFVQFYNDGCHCGIWRYISLFIFMTAYGEWPALMIGEYFLRQIETKIVVFQKLIRPFQSPYRIFITRFFLRSYLFAENMVSMSQIFIAFYDCVSFRQKILNQIFYF